MCLSCGRGGIWGLDSPSNGRGGIRIAMWPGNRGVPASIVHGQGGIAAAQGSQFTQVAVCLLDTEAR